MERNLHSECRGHDRPIFDINKRPRSLLTVIRPSGHVITALRPNLPKFGQRMSKTTVTNFTRRIGSPFQKASPDKQDIILQQEVKIQKSNYNMQKEKQHILEEKANKKICDIQTSKIANSDGFFVEIQSHGAFQNPKHANGKVNTNIKPIVAKQNNNIETNGSKCLMGFPSSANDLALEAKSDLESDKNISDEVKEKVIKKLFVLVSMVQHMYESKVRIMTEYDKFKEKYLKDESRREKEQSEQLYKLNMNFQTEVVQAIQQLKTELDISRNTAKTVEESNAKEDGCIDFSSTESHLENNDDMCSE